jgi:hypothetical protein
MPQNTVFKYKFDRVNGKKQYEITENLTKSLTHNTRSNIQLARGVHSSVGGLAAAAITLEQQYNDKPIQTHTSTVSISSLYENSRYYYLGGLTVDSGHEIAMFPENKIHRTDYATLGTNASLTGAVDPFAPVVQVLSYNHSNIGDTVKENAWKLFYTPISDYCVNYGTSADTAGATAAQSHRAFNNVVNAQSLQFFNFTNQHNAGPALAILSDYNLTGALSAMPIPNTSVSSISASTTTAMTLVMHFRPFNENNNYERTCLYHRYTTESGSALTGYTNTAYSTYLSRENKGVSLWLGKEFSYADNADTSAKPYVDFSVYGGFGANHYYDLSTGKINNQTDSRFYFTDKQFARLYDGRFHKIIAVWSSATSDNIMNGKVFLDGEELTNSVSFGSGRITPINYSLVNPKKKATNIYLFSYDDLQDDHSLTAGQLSKYTTYGEYSGVYMYAVPIYHSNPLFNPDDITTYGVAYGANLLGLDAVNFTSGMYGSKYLITATPYVGIDLIPKLPSLVMFMKFNVQTNAATQVYDCASNSISGTITTSVDSRFMETYGYGLMPTPITGTIISNLSSDGLYDGRIAKQLAVLIDKQDGSITGDFDSSNGTTYKYGAGKIYNCIGNGFDVENTHVGYIFYDFGHIIISNDSQDNLAALNGYFGTQPFVTEGDVATFDTINTSPGEAVQRYNPPTGSFVTKVWNVHHSDLVAQSFKTRTEYSITASDDFFSKSQNESSLFKAPDGNYYSKSNTKFITGIGIYNSKGTMTLVAKPSKPIIKKDNHDVVISFHFDI